MRLRPLAPDVPREATPIDEFFDSLAADLGEDAIGIVLSGTGHDGALGLEGDPRARRPDPGPGQRTARRRSTAGCRNSAIATGAVDLIVPVQDMPGLIVGIKDRHEAAGPAGPSALQTDTARLSICEVLFARVGHDFSQYKEATFLRRVQRRMQVLGLAGHERLRGAAGGRPRGGGAAVPRPADRRHHAFSATPARSRR